MNRFTNPEIDVQKIATEELLNNAGSESGIPTDGPAAE